MNDGVLLLKALTNYPRPSSVIETIIHLPAILSATKACGFKTEKLRNFDILKDVTHSERISITEIKMSYTIFLPRCSPLRKATTPWRKSNFGSRDIHESSVFRLLDLTNMYLRLIGGCWPNQSQLAKSKHIHKTLARSTRTFSKLDTFD